MKPLAAFRNPIASSILLIAVTISQMAFAAKIKQYISGSDQAVVALDTADEVKAGDALVATVNGKQCSLEVTKVEVLIAYVNTANCQFRNDLIIGQSLEKSLIAPAPIATQTQHAVQPKEISKPEPTVETAAHAKPTYFSIVVGLVPSSQMRFEGTVRTSTSSANGTLEYSHKPGALIGFEFSQFNQHSWNHGIQFDYSSLELDTLTATGSGSSSSTPVSGKMNITTLAYTGKYLWENFYLPLSLGFGSVSHSGDIPYLKGVTGSALFSLGLGINIVDNFNLEFQSRAIALTVSNLSNGTTTLSTTSGTFSEVALLGKFLF